MDKDKLEKAQAASTSEECPSTYKCDDYLFKMFDRIENIFTLKNDVIQISESNSVDIYEFAEKNNFEGIKEIIINKQSDQPAFVINESQIYPITADRFISFINDNARVKMFIISHLLKTQK